ncbi:MAG: hypothetical protein HQL90_13750 [Magnetococcales bacterium]|nr:hypothetical protein [Magnetococcales bacterium]
MNQPLARWLLAGLVTLSGLGPESQAGEPGPELGATRATAARPAKPTPPVTIQQPAVQIGPSPMGQQSPALATALATLQPRLQEGDRILPTDTTDQGYIQDRWLEESLLQQGESLLVQLTEPLAPGTLLMVYRPGVRLTDPATGEEMGLLAHNLGRVELTGETNHAGWRARLVALRDMIQPGDRLLRYQEIPTDFKAHAHPFAPVRGRILALPDATELAGHNQVVVVGLGRRDRVAQGLVLQLEHQPAPGRDPVSGQTLPKEPYPIGEAILFLVGEKASLALLGPTSHPVSRGDAITAH